MSNYQAHEAAGDPTPVLRLLITSKPEVILPETQSHPRGLGMRQSHMEEGTISRYRASCLPAKQPCHSQALQDISSFKRSLSVATPGLFFKESLQRSKRTFFAQLWQQMKGKLSMWCKSANLKRSKKKKHYCTVFQQSYLAVMLGHELYSIFSSYIQATVNLRVARGRKKREKWKGDKPRYDRIFYNTTVISALSKL